jgi:hypothetical protein
VIVYGTVFTVSMSGTERVLYYTFAAGSDGAHPYATLIEVNGELYGTTADDGTANWGSDLSNLAVTRKPAEVSFPRAAQRSPTCTVQRNSGFPGGVAFHQGEMSVGDQFTSIIYRESDDTTSRIIGSTLLKRTKRVGQFFIACGPSFAKPCAHANP